MTLFEAQTLCSTQECHVQETQKNNLTVVVACFVEQGYPVNNIPCYQPAEHELREAKTRVLFNLVLDSRFC